MVMDYQLERWRQEDAIENGGFRDERARERLVTFRDWLRHYPWPSVEDAITADGLAA
jgi:hypothetical protein